MKRFGRQMLSSVLALVMVISLIPVQVFAAEEEVVIEEIELEVEPEVTVEEVPEVTEAPETVLENSELHSEDEAMDAKLDFGSCGDNAEWELSDDGVLTIRGTGAMTNYDEPDSVPWVDYIDRITAVVVEEGITAIGSCAFYECIELTTLTLPDTLKTIEKAAFAYCPNLASFTLPENLEIIRTYAFDNCDGIDRVTIPSSVRVIEECAFSGCDKLTEIIILEGLTEIYELAFVSNHALEKVTLPESLSVIGESAFGECESLCDVYYNGSETMWKRVQIGEWNEPLTEATIHYGKETVVVSSGGCGEFLSYQLISEGVLTISGTGTMAAYDSASPAPWYEHRDIIKNVVLESGVSSVGSYAFDGCTKLESLTVPESVTTIGAKAFNGCTALTDLYFAGRPSMWKQITVDEGNEVLAEATMHCEKPEYPSGSCGENVTWILKEGILTISGTGAMDDYEFYTDVPWCQYMEEVTSVIIEDGVTSIGSNCFYNCTAMTSITIPATVTVIGQYAFFHNYVFEDVYYGGTLTQWHAVELGEHNEPLRYASVHCKLEENSGNCGTNATYTLDENGVMTISGTGAMTDYGHPNDLPWLEYRGMITSVVVEEGITSVGDFAFYQCHHLTSVTLPESLERIGEQAFRDCVELETIKIPDGVTNIAEYAFYWCSSLKEFSFPASLTIIERDVLSDCESLEKVFIPEGVTSIGKSAFNMCRNLKSVTLPDTLVNIGEYAFSNCTSLSNITIPSSVTTIGHAAFFYCTALKEIVIPDGVKHIGESAFQDDWKLVKVTIPVSVTYIGKKAFFGCEKLKSVTYKGKKQQWKELGFGEVKAVCSNGTVDKYGNDEKIVASGSCGDNVSFELARDGVLVISGSGPMKDYFSYDVGPYGAYTIPPWHGERCDVHVKTVIIENGVTTIGAAAFFELMELTTVIIPDSVTKIGTRAFTGCYSLTELVIPAGVTEIEEAQFERCFAFEKVRFGGTMEQWKAMGCRNVDAVCADGMVYVYASGRCGENLTWVLDDRVLTISGTGEMYRYNGLNNGGDNDVLGVSDAPWNSYRKSVIKVVIEDGVTTLSEDSFIEFEYLEEISLPEGITRIETGTFYGCKSLKIVNIPTTVTKIEGYAFLNCQSLEDLVIPVNVASIGDYAFAYCYSLMNVLIPEKVTTLGEGAFENCLEMKSIDIPVSVTEIGPYACFGNEKLRDVYYGGTKAQWNAIHFGEKNKDLKEARIHYTEPAVYSGDCGALVKYRLSANGVLTISGTGAMTDFAAASDAPWWELRDQITEIEVKIGVTNVGSYAFADCNALTKVTIPVTVKVIDPHAFDGCTALEKVYYKAYYEKLLKLEVREGNEPFTAAKFIWDEPSKTEAPKLLSAEVGDGEITISWEKIFGVSSYRVYRKDSGSSKWRNIAHVKGGTFTDNSVVHGKTYTYSVCSLNSNDEKISPYNTTGLKATYYAEPNILSIQNTANGVKLTWQKMSNVSRYGVYLLTADGWERIAVTAATNYTYKEAVSGEEQTFRISCMSKDGTKDLSKVYKDPTSALYIAQPEIASNAVEAEGVNLTWEEVPGAENYTLLVKTGKKWVEVGTVTDTMCLFTSAVSGKTYNFAVRANGADGTTSSYNTAGKTIKYIGQPAVKLSNTTSGIKVSWAKVSGAAKYRLLMLDENGEWVKLKDTTSTSYTYKDILHGESAAFMVVCIDSKGKKEVSARSEAAVGMYVEAPVLGTVENVFDGVKLTWSEVTDADSYVVLVKSGKTWAEAGTATGTEYVYTGAASGKSVTLTVKAVVNDTEGAYNATGKKLTRIAPPAVKLSNTTSGIKVSWGKVSGAAKYRVLMLDENGEWVKQKDTTSTSYTYKGAAHGESYSFMVVCIDSKGKKEVSARSEAETCMYVEAPVLNGVENVVDGVKLTWTEVAGADSYIVLVKSGKLWTEAGGTTDTEFVYTGAASGKSVTLTVKAVKDGTEGAYNTTGKKLTYIAQPVVTLTETETGVKLSWSKVGGASKYRVALVNEDGKLIKLKDTTSTSYTYTKIEEGKSYKFTVACLNSKGKIIGSYNTDGWIYPLPA